MIRHVTSRALGSYMYMPLAISEVDQLVEFGFTWIWLQKNKIIVFI